MDRLVPSAGGGAGGASRLVTIEGANFGTDKDQVPAPRARARACVRFVCVRAHACTRAWWGGGWRVRDVSLHLYLYPSIHPSIDLSIHPSLSIYLSIYLAS